MNRCQCQKADRKQCSRDAKSGSQFCWQHQNCQKMVKPSQKKPTSQKKTVNPSQKKPTLQKKTTAPQNVSKTQQKVIDPEIKQAYKSFTQDYEFDQPLLIEDFEQAYNEVKEHWVETMGEFLNIEDYDFDEEQKLEVYTELASSYPEKYTGSPQ